MIKICCAPVTRSIRVVWLCEELELPYAAVWIDYSLAYRNSPEYRRLNPVGKVPAMTDGDLVMFESGAMLEYLLERYGNGRLRPPPGTPASARYLQWSWFAEASFMRPLSDMAQHAFVRPEPERIPAMVEDGRIRATQCLDAVDAALAGGGYLVNDTFTAADIMMGYTLYLARRLKVLTPERHPNANAYYARLEGRPGFVVARTGT